MAIAAGVSLSAFFIARAQDNVNKHTVPLLCVLCKNSPLFINMGTHMKTTIEVSDALFTSAKRLAQQSQTTLRALVEDGLRRVLSDAQGTAKPTFTLRDASVHGQELLIPDARDWQALEAAHVTQQLTKTQP